MPHLPISSLLEYRQVRHAISMEEFIEEFGEMLVTVLFGMVIIYVFSGFL